MKKATNKLMSFLAAFAMVLSVLVAPFTSANAAKEEPTQTTVVLTKVLLENLEGWPKKADTDVNGVNYIGQNLQDENNNQFQKYFGSKAEPLKGVDFKITQLNEDGTETPYNGGEVFTTDENGQFRVTLPNGKYRIDEISTSYVGPNGETITNSAAVPVEIELPMVRPDGTYFSDAEGDELYIYPKNVQKAPKIDKNFDNEANKDAAAISTDDLINNANKDKDVEIKTDDNKREKGLVTKNIGDKVPYKVVTEIPQNAKYKKLVWTDTMTKGLTYNKDLTATLGTTPLENTDYTVINTDRGFTLKLTDPGLKKVEEAAKTEAQTITLKYTATVNENAEVDVEDENDVALDYSNKPGKESEPKEGQPSNGEIKVSKTWAIDGNKVTEADKTVTALFTLQEKQADGSWKDVDRHAVGSDANFEHTFKGLDNKKTYRVVEQVSGYEPEYVSFNNGVVEIRNDKDSKNPKTLNPSEPKVVTGGKKFVKTNQDGKQRLAGAEFYVKNSKGEYLVPSLSQGNDVAAKKSALDDAVKAYNALTEEQQKGPEGTNAKAAIDKAQDEYNKAFKAAATKYEFAAKTGENAPANAVVLVSDGQGRFEITGLEYGDYKLEEKTEPKGYAKLSEDVPFKVAKGTYAGKATEFKYEPTLAEGETQTYGKQVINKKVTIPQTGGIGSLIFIVAGLALMGVAFVAMKRRNSYEEA